MTTDQFYETLLDVMKHGGALGFGGRFLWSNWRLVREPGRDWARRNFLGSMTYLVGLFIAVAVDVSLG